MLSGELRRRSEARDAVIAAAGEQIWIDVVEKPIGDAIVRRFADDTVRGVVATDALIGTHTSLFDPDLLANRCFLYHLIGRGTGEWLVPIGGMGAVTDALRSRAVALGVEIACKAEVLAANEIRCAGHGQRPDRRRGAHADGGVPAGRGRPGGGRRLAGPGADHPHRCPDQDQHAAGPVAPPGIRAGPAHRVRRHHASRGGLLGAGGRLRQHRRRRAAGDPAQRGLLPLVVRPLDPERALGRHPDPVRIAHAGRTCSAPTRRPPGCGPRRPR